MKTRTLTRLLLIASFVILAAGSATAQGPEPDNLNASPSAGAKFTFYDVDSDYSHDYGQYPSLAIDPLTDMPYVSYYDAVGKKLRLAHKVSSSGNCGYDGRRFAWYCETVPLPPELDSHDVGKNGSMAIYSNSAASPRWKLGIAYFDVTSSSTTPALFYSVYTCTVPGSCSWSTFRVDSGFDLLSSSGTTVSLKFDSAGNPLIAYASGTANWNSEIRYAHYVEGGTGSWQPNWQCDVAIAVYQNMEITLSLSLDLDDADRPHIAYSTRMSLGYMHLRHAWLTTASGNCAPSGNWQCEMVDSTRGGPSVSLQVGKGPLALPRIAYYSSISAGAQSYSVAFAAKRPVTGGNCGPTGMWQCDFFPWVQSGTGLGVSFAEDSEGYPVIAYRDPSARGGGRLAWAQPIARLGLATGNCGLGHSWQCDLVGGTYGTIFGRQPSLALNSAGLAYIASYDDTPPGFLEISYQQRQVYLPFTRR